MVGVTKNFLIWWQRELRSFVPSNIDILISHPQIVALFTFRDEKLSLDQIQGAQSKYIDTFSLQTSSDTSNTVLQDTIHAALRPVAAKATIIALDLPITEILRRTLTFPAIAEKNLRQVVQYEMERRTSFKPDEVYFTTSVTGRSPETQEIEVALAVVPRTTVDEAVEQMAQLGLRPERVGASAQGLSAAEGVNFLPTDGARKTPRWAVAGTGALGLVTAGLLIAVILLPLEMKRDRATKLSAEVAALRTNAVAASRLTTEIEALRARNRFIQTQRNSAQPAVKVLDDLTRLLPDDAWVFQLRLQKGKVSAQGYATAVSALVERIESDPRFRNVAVQSRVTRDPKTGMERFHLTFDLAGSEA